MRYEETHLIELKEQFNAETIVKDIVAFLNSEGGDIYVGISEKTGLPVALKQDPDEISRSISDIITNQIEPTARNLVSEKTVYENGLPVIAISVAKGINDKLYYIKKYGRSVAGCFERIGTTAKPLTEQQIDARFIAGIRYQPPQITEIESYWQNLTFQYLKNYLVEPESTSTEKTSPKTISF